jgi:hypothetical protein
METMTMFFFFITILLMIFLLYKFMDTRPLGGGNEKTNTIIYPNVYSDPYVPPIQPIQGFPLIPLSSPIPKPLLQRNVIYSVNTQPTNYSFDQIGILNKTSSSDNNALNILPLFGRILLSNRNKWQYYTISNLGVKLPIRVNGKDGLTEYGVDELYDGDTVYVQGYNETFRVTIYTQSGGISYL